MAADNRNFADVLDIQGTEVCLSDKKLAETSSETGVQTTDYVLLQDTDGAYHKILKSNFTEAIRNTLAGLLVNNDKGTSVNQIPAIASGDLGSVTPANLASVLGGQSALTNVVGTNLFNKAYSDKYGLKITFSTGRWCVQSTRLLFDEGTTKADVIDIFSYNGNSVSVLQAKTSRGVDSVKVYYKEGEILVVPKDSGQSSFSVIDDGSTRFNSNITTITPLDSAPSTSGWTEVTVTSDAYIQSYPNISSLSYAVGTEKYGAVLNVGESLEIPTGVFSLIILCERSTTGNIALFSVSYGAGDSNIHIISDPGSIIGEYFTISKSTQGASCTITSRKNNQMTGACVLHAY